jgi:SHS2 domain-containing protein
VNRSIPPFAAGCRTFRARLYPSSSHSIYDKRDSPVRRGKLKCVPGAASAGSIPAVQEFRVLEHTADIGFEAFGAKREDVFRNAGRALMSLIIDLESVRPQHQVRLEARAPEQQGLLVNWLSEILYLQDTENWLFNDFEIDGLENESVASAGRGERFNPRRHQIKLLVKAITYHQLSLEETPDGLWRAQVYVDI